jgi:hypothetical protein
MAHYTDLKTALSDPHQYGGYGSLRQYSYHGIDPTLGNTAGSMTPFPTGDRYDRTPIEEPEDEDEDEEIDNFVDMLATDKVYKKLGGTTYVNDFGAQASTDARTLTKGQQTIAEQMSWDTAARPGLSPFSRSTLYGQDAKGNGPSIAGDNLATKWATDSAGAPMRQTGTLGWAHPAKSLSDLDDEPVIFNLEDFLNSPTTDKAARSMFRHQYNVKKILSNLEKE